MAEETGHLAQFVLDMGARELPVSLGERARCLMLDAVANGFLGSRQAAFRMAARMVAGLGGSGSAHVFGSSETLDASRAAFLNGIAIHAFESDHNAYDAHPAGVVFPAVVALGESLGATGSSVLRAFVAGYEVNIRVSAALTNRTERERGFHNPGISGAFGSAAGCALLLGLSLEETEAALGIAGSHGGGLMEWSWTGAMTKRMHLGRAAQMGLESALLAANGFSGPPTILEGPYGFLQAYSPAPEIDRLVEGLGSRFLFEEVRVKPYPGHSASQPFLPALEQWHALGIDPSRIEEVHVTTSERGAETRFWDVDPSSVLRAQYSLPFAVALVLARGLDGYLALDEGALHDEFLSSLAARVTISADERFQGSPLSAGGEVRVTVDGATETLAAPGVPQYSLEELWTLCRSKLEWFSRGVLSPEHIARIEAAVAGIDEIDSIGELAELIFVS